MNEYVLLCSKWTLFFLPDLHLMKEDHLENFQIHYSVNKSRFKATKQARQEISFPGALRLFGVFCFFFCLW